MSKKKQLSYLLWLQIPYFILFDIIFALLIERQHVIFVVRFVQLQV